MKHWIRDLQITFPAATHGTARINYVLFHFLRVAGWQWLWECDGNVGDNPNHVPDGNMETAGVGSWTGLFGATLAKVTTPLRSGTQALHVDSAGGASGAESSALTSMEDSTEYHVAIWAWNDSGDEWDVAVDTGTGSYTIYGAIPDNGGTWGLYHFTFTTASSGTRKIKIVDNDASGNEIFISDVHIFRSYFEYNAADSWQGGVDGTITNPDQFGSGSYTFVGGDVGKVVCIWDTTNLGNSGAYKISSVAAGIATLNLRSGSAALTSWTGLDWRMVDLSAAPDNSTSANDAERGAGFGLQSPHSSGHRLFVRQAQFGPTGLGVDLAGIWAAPEATDFDFSTGTFYKSGGTSSQNDRQTAYTLPTSNTAPWSDMHVFESGANTVGTRRLFLMTDDDGSFLTILSWDETGGTTHDTFVLGYLGTDVQHPGVEEWGLFARWRYFYNSGYFTSISFTNTVDKFTYSGTVIGPDGQAEQAKWAQLGYYTSLSDVVTQSNAGPNRWSGDEWVHKPIIARDPSGADDHPSERDADIGIYQGRQNMVNLSTFDSDSYLHFDNGLVWEWSGETVLP